MIWTVEAKVYPGTSVLLSAFEVEVESRMVAVVGETLKVKMERCSETACAQAVCTTATACVANGAVYDSCHSCSTWSLQTGSHDGEGHEIEVLVLDLGVVVPVGESLTEIYQAEMQEFLG